MRLTENDCRCGPLAFGRARRNPLRLVFSTGGNGPEYGMELRDYFAAKAMQGLCSMIATGNHDVSRDEPEKDIADQAYAMADAMLAARQK